MEPSSSSSSSSSSSNVSNIRRRRLLGNYLPVGYKFQPDDEDIMEYLKQHVLQGVAVDPQLIQQVNIYSTEPSALASAYKFPLVSDDAAETMYFFSQRQLLGSSGAGKRVKRTTAGGGHWHGNGADRAIRSHSSGEVVGYKTTNLTFVDAEGVKTSWIMDEYRLPAQQFQDMVLCKIRKSPTGKRKVIPSGDHVDHQGRQPPNSSSKRSRGHTAQPSAQQQQALISDQQPAPADAEIALMITYPTTSEQQQQQQQQQHISTTNNTTTRGFPDQQHSQEFGYGEQQPPEQGSTASAGSSQYQPPEPAALLHQAQPMPPQQHQQHQQEGTFAMDDILLQMQQLETFATDHDFLQESFASAAGSCQYQPPQPTAALAVDQAQSIPPPHHHHQQQQQQQQQQERVAIDETMFSLDDILLQLQQHELEAFATDHYFLQPQPQFTFPEGDDLFLS